MTQTSLLLTFYAFLGTSAAVFLGIQGALLVSKVVSIENERNQIERRIKELELQREDKKSRFDIAIKEKREIEEKWEDKYKKEIRRVVDKFINDDCKPVDKPPEKITVSLLVKTLRDGEDESEEPDPYYTEYISERMSDIQRILAKNVAIEYVDERGEDIKSGLSQTKFIEDFKKQKGADNLLEVTRSALIEQYEEHAPPRDIHGGIQKTRSDSIFPFLKSFNPTPFDSTIFMPSKLSATSQQIRSIRDIQEERRYTEIRDRINRISGQIDSIEKECRYLSEQYNTISNPSRLKKTVLWLRWPMIFAIIVPVVVATMNILGLYVPWGSKGVEVLLVVILWLFGVFLSLFHINSEIKCLDKSRGKT